MKDGYMSVKLCVHRSLLTSGKKEKESLKLETENAAQIEKNTVLRRINSQLSFTIIPLSVKVTSLESKRRKPI